MNNLSNSTMTLFLLFVLIIALVITFAILAGRPKRLENFRLYGGRNPKGSFDCCGNIDWFLGPKLYKKTCPGDVPPAFQDTSAYNAYYNPINNPQAHKYFEKLQENFTNQEKECKEENLLPSYNPTICTVDKQYNPYANCKCVDAKNNCKKCFPNINLGKYE